MTHTPDPDVFEAMEDATPTDQGEPEPEAASPPQVVVSPQPNAIQLRDGKLDVTTHAELYRLAERTFHSNIKIGGANCVEDVFVALMTGLEAGLSLSATMHSVYVVNGRPTMYGDKLLGLVLTSGTCADLEEWYDEEKQTAFCKAVRIHKLIDGETMRRECQRSFSVKQAKTAGLWGKKGPWTHYPERMLQHKARNLVMRDAFPDVIGGLFMREDVDDYVVFDPSQMRTAKVGTSAGLLDDDEAAGDGGEGAE